MAYDFISVKAKADNNDVRAQVTVARMLWLGLPEQRVEVDRKGALRYLSLAANRFNDSEAIDLIYRLKIKKKRT